MLKKEYSRNCPHYVSYILCVIGGGHTHYLFTLTLSDEFPIPAKVLERIEIFYCPEYGIAISPEDSTEEKYSIVEPK